MIVKNEIWERQEDGTLILIRIEDVEVPDVDPIKEKEEQLLKLYNELEQLKNNNNN
jgi:hypothetical protein